MRNLTFVTENLLEALKEFLIATPEPAPGDWYIRDLVKAYHNYSVVRYGTQEEADKLNEELALARSSPE